MAASQNYISFCVLHPLTISTDYQTINYFLNKWNPLPTKFRKNFLYNSEDNNVSIVIFDVYFDLSCVNVASDNYMHIFLLLVKSIGLTKETDRKRIWSHLLKKSSMENFIFCAVNTK